MSTAIGDGSNGVPFYFSTGASVSVTSNSGNSTACVNASSGTEAPMAALYLSRLTAQFLPRLPALWDLAFYVVPAGRQIRPRFHPHSMATSCGAVFRDIRISRWQSRLFVLSESR